MKRKLKTLDQRAKVKSESARATSGRELKFYETPEFKKLNKKWHQVLERKGFEDCEEFDSPLELMKTNHNEKFRIKTVPEEFIAKRRYFELASQLLHDYSFRDNREQLIWRLHSEGAPMNEIATKSKTNIKMVKEFIKSLQKRITR